MLPGLAVVVGIVVVVVGAGTQGATGFRGATGGAGALGGAGVQETGVGVKVKGVVACVALLRLALNMLSPLYFIAAITAGDRRQVTVTSAQRRWRERRIHARQIPTRSICKVRV